MSPPDSGVAKRPFRGSEQPPKSQNHSLEASQQPTEDAARLEIFYSNNCAWSRFRGRGARLDTTPRVDCAEAAFRDRRWRAWRRRRQQCANCENSARRGLRTRKRDLDDLHPGRRPSAGEKCRRPDLVWTQVDLPDAQVFKNSNRLCCTNILPPAFGGLLGAQV